MAEQEEVRTDTATLIATLRSIAECDPAYRDIATQAADRMETMWSLTRALLMEETEQDRIIAERDAARAEADRLNKFVRGLARCWTVDEFDADAPNRADDDQDLDYEGAYDSIVKSARRLVNGGTHD